MNRQKLEDLCRRMGMAPERRESAREGDIYIADGFTAIPHLKFKDVKPGEFPYGCFHTAWFVAKDDEAQYGPVLFFDAMHDKGWDPATKKAGRINKAVKEAKAFLKKREAERVPV